MGGGGFAIKNKTRQCIRFRNGDDRVVLIAQPGLDYRQAVEQDVPRVVGTLSSKRTCEVVLLYVPPLQRAQGHAVTLLGVLAQMLAEDGCCRIELDDMSDRYRNNRNVYTRVGFQYRSHCGPEMAASRRRVVQSCKRIIGSTKVTLQVTASLS